MARVHRCDDGKADRSAELLQGWQHAWGGAGVLGGAVNHGAFRGRVLLIDMLRLIWGMEPLSARAAAPPERVEGMFGTAIAGPRPEPEATIRALE